MRIKKELRFKNLRGKMKFELFKKKKRQTTFIYCMKCNNELVSSDSFVKDENGIVTYKCDRCGNVAQYDFIHYPVPLLVKNEKK